MIGRRPHSARLHAPRAVAGPIVLALWLAAPQAPARARAQGVDSTRVTVARPLVAGGYDDKPYLTGIFGRIAVGGYAEFHARWEQVDGATEEAGFHLKRWNLLTHTRVSTQVDVWAEVEFEDGGEEIVLELAQLDFQPHAALGLRCGMLLLPIGRFNLSHDGPRNEFTDRPLLATDLLGTALSMPGIGLFGQLPAGGDRRATYELYAVNGFNAGIIDNSGDGTRLPAGRFNPEDNNASASFVGRAAWDAGLPLEIGLSGFRGVYNVTRIDGLDVDEGRFVQVRALDVRARLLGFEWNGEGALVGVDIPPGLSGLYAGRQAGFFFEVGRDFRAAWASSMPEASLSAAARVEGVDFDRDLAGDSVRQLTLGVHFRPTRHSVYKLDYQRGRHRDRFNNPSEAAGVLFSLATYF